MYAYVPIYIYYMYRRAYNVHMEIRMRIYQIIRICQMPKEFELSETAFHVIIPPRE